MANNEQTPTTDTNFLNDNTDIEEFNLLNSLPQQNSYKRKILKFCEKCGCSTLILFFVISILIVVVLKKEVININSNTNICQNTNLLKNGGFEEPFCSSNTCAFTGIPGWAVYQSSGVPTSQIEINTYSTFATAEGRQCSDMSSGGQVQQYIQSVSTIAGNTYALTYYYSGNPNCDNNAIVMMLNESVYDISRIILHTTVFSYLVGGSVSSPTQMNWASNTIQFKAISKTTNIYFSGYSPVNSCGPVIDNIIVTCI